MQVQQPQLSTSKELQCPMCFLMFPMQHIQEQADNCSPWAMESEQSPDLSECEISVEMEAAKQLPQLNMSQYKSLLKDEIVRCPTLPGYLPHFVGPHCWTTLFPFMCSLVHGVYKSSVLYGNHSFCCALFLALAIAHIRSYCRRAVIRWGRTLVTLEFGADKINLQRQKNYQEKLINRQLIIIASSNLPQCIVTYVLCWI